MVTPGASAPSTRNKHVWAWYCYSFAAEVFSACALAIFIPIALEKVARDVGYLSPDWTAPCSVLDPGDNGNDGSDETEPGEVVCRAKIFGLRVDSASFSMYTKSIAVALQALCIITVGPLADSSFWRKRLLILSAILGALSGILFLPLPSGSSATPILAALLTITGNVGYAVGTVCSNAFLPELAREVSHASVKGINGAAGGRDGERERGEEGEDEPLLEDTLRGRGRVGRVAGVQGMAGRVAEVVVHGAAGAHPQTEELPPFSAPIEPGSIAPTDTPPHLRSSPARGTSLADLSSTTSRLSSTCTALGFFSGVSVLALLLVPVTLMGGSTFSLRLAVGLSGVWWIVFLIPAALGLPGAEQIEGGKGKGSVTLSMGDGWRRVGRMVRPDEMRRLSNLFTFLLTWIFLSDGFHTTTYIAILYASSQLHMSATKVGIIGILVQLTAVFSSVATPKLQRRMGWTNQQLLLRVAIAGGVLPMYACAGLILPFGGLRREGEMYVAAVWFGMLYGPFNSYSRAVYAELIPPGHESSFFSLFALTDKSASFVGPFIVGVIADTTGNIRLGFLFLLVMLAIPVPVLMRVDMERGKREARDWKRYLGESD